MSEAETAKPAERLQQSLLAELDKALKRLSPKRQLTHKDIHESRKSLRRVRAALRFLRDEGDREAIELDGILKRARARLSQLRDAGSSIETIDRLRPQLADAGLRKALSHWRRELNRHSGQSLEQFAGSRARILLHGRIKAARARLQALAMPGEKRQRRALARSLRKARKAVAQVRGQHSAVRRHATRRRVRLLMLQLRWFEALSLARPKAIEPDRLERLTKALGNENDLAVLHRRARSHAPALPTGLIDWIEARRRATISRNDRRTRTVLGRAR
ncbi:MAG: CHAD domain-containing protein [Xanthomonadales bacterium]|nr:CHAD domain-containing protein [Xanthomonadales bacterium]MCB1643149.1 CHAD domain-containing protein [Xanthomonadales bacterium]